LTNGVADTGVTVLNTLLIDVHLGFHFDAVVQDFDPDLADFTRTPPLHLVPRQFEAGLTHLQS